MLEWGQKFQGGIIFKVGKNYLCVSPNLNLMKLI